MTPAAGAAIWVADVVVVGALAGSPAGAGAALVVTALLLPFPVFVEGPPLVRAVLAIGLVVCMLKALDLRRGSPIPGFARRVGHVLAIFDTRCARRRPAGLDRSALVRVAVAGALALAALGALRATAVLTGAPRYATRWLSVAALLFAWFETMVALLRVAAAASGMEAPLLHDRPQESRSLSEFWARRWNRVVSSLLHDLCFRPAARVSPALGLIAAFAASAAIHGYAMGVALGLVAGLSWAAFFLAQPLLIAAERASGARRWPPMAGRAWTVAALALPAPLFLEPVARLFE